VNVTHPASLFGRHEFLVRRLHSLTGLIPIGGYLCFHLATNAAVLDGIETYQRRADQIHVIGPTTLFMLEWTVIFLPILFHGLIGMLIVTRGQRNVKHYSFAENWRYTLQRVTGVIAFAFILWHVFEMHGWFRFSWWVEGVAGPLGGAKFDPQDVATAAVIFQASPLTVFIYTVGVLASVYHLANGFWTMGITWGIWTSPQAQRRMNIPCAALGAVLAVVGLGAIWGMLRVDLPQDELAAARVQAASDGRQASADLDPPPLVRLEKELD